MKFVRLGLGFIWGVLLWGMLGVILKAVTTQTPDWAVSLMAVIGCITMWLYIFFREA